MAQILVPTNISILDSISPDNILDNYHEYLIGTPLFKTLVENSAKYSSIFGKKKSESVKTIIYKALNEQIIKILSKMNLSFDDAVVEWISARLISTYFAGAKDFDLGFSLYELLIYLANVDIEFDLKDLTNTEHLELDSAFNGLLLSLSVAITTAIDIYNSTRKIEEGDVILNIIKNIDATLIPLSEDPTTTEIYPEVIDETKSAILPLMVRETYLANNDTFYNQKAYGKFTRYGFLKPDEIFKAVTLDNNYKATVYKGYYNSHYLTNYQFKEICIGDTLAIVQNVQGDEFKYGYFTLDSEVLQTISSGDDSALEVFYNHVKALEQLVLASDAALIILNISCYFISYKDADSSQPYFQPLTLPVSEFSSFNAFRQKMFYIVNYDRDDKNPYYNESELGVFNLMLDLFAVHTTRREYFKYAGKLGAGKHATDIPLIYNIEKGSLTDGMCGFNMLNTAYGMDSVEFLGKNLFDLTQVLEYLHSKYSFDGKCLPGCSGQFFDEEGMCMECRDNFVIPDTDNKLAIIADGFVIDALNLTEITREEKVTVTSTIVDKCIRHFSFVCKCKTGKCAKCFCAKCKLVPNGTREIIKPISYKIPPIGVKYLFGNAQSTHKYVLTHDKKNNVYHVDKIVSPKFSGLPLKFKDDTDLKSLCVMNGELREFDGDVVADVRVINKRAQLSGITEAFSQKAEYKEFILFLDFECVTIKDDHGMRQVPYSFSILKVSKEELKGISDADRAKPTEETLAVITAIKNRTEFILAKEICPEGFSNPAVITADIGKYLFNYLQNAAMDCERFTIVTFNGTNYDHLILNQLISDIDCNAIDNVFWSGSKLNNMKLFGMHEMFDIRRHLVGSLDGLCKSYKIKSVAKGSFDHKAANVASREGKLFDFLNQDMEKLIEYNKLDVICMAVILYRYDTEIKTMNENMPKLLKGVSEIFERDKDALIKYKEVGGKVVRDDTWHSDSIKVREHISYESLKIDDIWKYPTSSSFILNWLRKHWAACNFTIENYAGQTIKHDAPESAKRTVKVVNKKNRVDLIIEYRFYRGVQGDKCGGRVCMRYISSRDKTTGQEVRKTMAMFFKGRRFSIDCCSLYPTAVLIAKEYVPYGNRIESMYNQEDPRIGFFWCRITQLTDQNKNIFRPLRVNKENAAHYQHLTDLSERLNMGNDWNYTGVIERVMIDTSEINYLRSKGCIVEPLNEFGFYFTAKIKNFYLFSMLLCVMQVKNQQDSYSQLISDMEKKLKADSNYIASESELNAASSYNPVLRETSKLILNGALGKLIQRVFTDKTKWCTYEEYTKLATDGCNPQMLTDFRIDGKVLVKYSVNEIDNISSSMPAHLGVFVYGMSKRLMNESILFKLGGEQFDYSDTDSCHINEEQFNNWTKWINEENVLVDTWDEIRELMPIYKTHKIYEPNSKVFGSFENELPKSFNHEIILGNKLYLCYDKEEYDNCENNNSIKKVSSSGKKVYKVSSAGINFNSYWVVADYNGLFNYINKKFGQKFIERGEIITNADVIEIVNNGEVTEEEVKEFVYRNNPRRAFLETLKYGFIVLIREVFKRNIKQNQINGTASSTISINVDMKIMKRNDFIDSEDDKQMMEEIDNHNLFTYLYSMKKRTIVTENDVDGIDIPVVAAPLSSCA